MIPLRDLHSGGISAGDQPIGFINLWDFTIFIGIQGSLCQDILILNRSGIASIGTRGSQMSKFNDMVEHCANLL